MTSTQRLGGCEHKAWLANVDPVLNKRWKQLMEQRQRAAQLAAAHAAAEAADAAEAAAEDAVDDDAAADSAAADSAAAAAPLDDASPEAREATAAAQSSSDAGAVAVHASHEPSPPPSQRPAAAKRPRSQQRRASSPPQAAAPPPVEDEEAYMQWLLALQQQEQGISAADVVKQRKRARTQLLDPSLYHEPRVRKPGAARQHKPKVGSSLGACMAVCCCCAEHGQSQCSTTTMPNHTQAVAAKRTTPPSRAAPRAAQPRPPKQPVPKKAPSASRCACRLKWVVHMAHVRTYVHIQNPEKQRRRQSIGHRRASCARERKAARVQVASTPARPTPQQQGDVPRESRKRRHDTRQLLRDTGEGDVSDLITWKELKVWVQVYGACTDMGSPPTGQHQAAQVWAQ